MFTTELVVKCVKAEKRVRAVEIIDSFSQYFNQHTHAKWLNSSGGWVSGVIATKINILIPEHTVHVRVDNRSLCQR